MLEVLHAVVRILVGWFGVSFIVGGLWIVAATSMRRMTKSDVIVAGVLMLIGAAFVWAALNLV
ncbi:MAG TPA: hypothetical protein VGL99_28660 [Chloroflexota bacterium]|jgi:hypothetical protein